MNPIEVVVKRQVYLVYQCGIANVFIDRAGRLMRVLQCDFRSCEYFARGAEAVGAVVLVRHCDKAGDIAPCQEDWQEGRGTMFAESKMGRGTL